MSKPMRTFWILCLACAAVHAQTSNASPTFEAASVKQSPPFEPGQGVWERRDGGPGTKDPGRIDWRNVPLGAIVIIAYDIKIFQLSGPDWLKNTRFDVSATIELMTVNSSATWAISGNKSDTHSPLRPRRRKRPHRAGPRGRSPI